jgi:hypothetical protein
MLQMRLIYKLVAYLASLPSTEQCLTHQYGICFALSLLISAIIVDLSDLSLNLPSFATNVSIQITFVEMNIYSCKSYKLKRKKKTCFRGLAFYKGGGTSHGAMTGAASSSSRSWYAFCEYLSSTLRPNNSRIISLS